MSIRESRKKIQRSIEFIAREYPAAVALPELRKISETAFAEILKLSPDGPIITLSSDVGRPIAAVFDDKVTEAMQ